MSERRAIILVGHGGVPIDYPRDQVRRLKALEGQREARGGPVGDEERALDTHIRAWPRSAQNDPYRGGLEALAAALQPLLGDTPLRLAYNEFCAPSLADAVAALLADGVCRITVVPSMLTPGGSHAEIDIPRTLARLRTAHPQAELHYAWPVDLSLLARFFATHLQHAP